MKNYVCPEVIWVDFSSADILTASGTGSDEDTRGPFELPII